MDNELVIREAEPDDLNTVGWLAQVIWPTAYKKILPKKQLDYMLELIYSPDSLKDQMQRQEHIFLIAEMEEEAVGFASYSKIAEPSIFKLHKLYVRTDIQGKGL